MMLIRSVVPAGDLPPPTPEKKNSLRGLVHQKVTKRREMEMKQTKQQVDNDSRGYLIAQPPIAKINEP